MNNELYHHGVKGMKWGVRHDPERKGRKRRRQDPNKPTTPSKGPGGRKPPRKISSTVVGAGIGAGVGLIGSAVAAKILQNNEDKNVADLFKDPNVVVNGTIFASYTTGLFGSYIAKAVAKDKTVEVPRIDVQKSLNLSDEDYAKLKKYAKVAGIALGTSAGLLAAGYIVTRKPFFTDYNKGLSPFSLGLNSRSLMDNPVNGSYIGDHAKEDGYGIITSDFIKDSISGVDPASYDFSESRFNNLTRSVRMMHVDDSAQRRLSCWSASNAYYMSAMTGKSYISKSFENLVNFNTFSGLYNKKPDIFSINGKKSSSFVGRIDSLGVGERASERDAEALVQGILQNLGSSTSLTPDKSRTIGFINAAYHGEACTHEWNFEIKHLASGVKELIMADGYSGDRYSVGKMQGNAMKEFVFNDGFGKLVAELRHYNRDSIRYYAPNINSINPEAMAKVILGRK